MNKRSGYALVEIMILVVIIGLLGSILLVARAGCATGGMGPTNTLTVTVSDKHVDADKESGSHYMVNTDKGTFEVDNGLLLGVWNADELYGKLLAGHTYNITTKGNRVVNIFMQEYPYITAVSPAPPR